MVSSGGSFTAALREMPAEIAQIEEIVHRAPVDLKMALIDYYARGHHVTHHATQRGITKWAFIRLVRRAESYVRSELF